MSEKLVLDSKYYVVFQYTNKCEKVFLHCLEMEDIVPTWFSNDFESATNFESAENVESFMAENFVTGLVCYVEQTINADLFVCNSGGK